MKSSPVFDLGSGLEVTNDTIRSSTSAYIDPSETALISCIEKRATHFFGLKEDELEPLQVVRYGPTQHFLPHLDTFSDMTEGSQRLATILVYLNDDDLTGGHTEFPLLGFQVAPRKNAALAWYNLDEQDLIDSR